MKLTPWFPGTVKPVHVGVYERKYPNGYCFYNYWTSKKTWSSPSSTPKEAVVIKSFRSVYQNLPWRGVQK